MSELTIYTDASYNKNYKIGVAGYLIINSVNNSEIIKLVSISEANNNRVEFISLIWALKTLDPEKQKDIQVYTDSRAITNLLSRKAKLETTNFISKRSNKILSNADIYKEFFKIISIYNPTINWIKGHSPNHNNEIIQSNFSKIDKLVRKELRSIISDIKKARS